MVDVTAALTPQTESPSNSRAATTPHPHPVITARSYAAVRITTSSQTGGAEGNAAPARPTLAMAPPSQLPSR